jgi:hypothetical protein
VGPDDGEQGHADHVNDELEQKNVTVGFEQIVEAGIHEVLNFPAEVEIEIQADRRDGDEHESEHPNDVPGLQAALNENDFPFGAGVVKGIVRGMRVSHW